MDPICVGQLFQSARKTIQCQKQDATTPNKDGRLLMAEIFRASTLHQLHLGNKAVEVYRHIRVPLITGLAYISSVRKILVATKSGYKILSYRLDDKQPTVILQKVACNYMAVDERRGHVFLSVLVPVVAVSKMNTNGRCYKVIQKLSGTATGIAVLPKRELIVLGLRHNLRIIGYDGRSMMTLRNTAVDSLTVDQTKDIIYFSEDSSVCQYDLVSRKRKELIKFSAYPTSLVYHQGHLYVQDFKLSDAVVWRADAQSGAKDRLFTSRVTLLFCVIP